MRKFYRMLLAILIVSSISLSATAQQKYWSLYNGSRTIPTDKAVARQSFPKEFKLFSLNISSLRQTLFSITGNMASRHSTVITLPNTDGNEEQFEVVEASNFEPALQARYPEIRAFSGRGLTDRSATLKLSISPQGIQTMVFRTEKANEFIEAYSADRTVYAVFNSQRQPGTLPWSCTTPDEQLANGINTQVSTMRLESSDGNLRVMRLAQSCNGEYANFHGATSAAQEGLVLAAFNATITRCNGVFEKDLAIHLNLILGTTAVIFYDPATDPYTTNLNQWNLQLQQTLTNLLGSAAYDIGHMFGRTGGGGNAGCIGCVCVDPPNINSVAKGGGITSPADGIPQGDNFDIDYVVHEMGHQMGGTHSFSHNNEGSGTNKEVGSGITIMGYAGITNQDVAPHSIDIFHETSIQQISANMSTKVCPVTTNISAVNATPVVAPVGNFTIPLSTPFALTGSATDANAGDVLTYCWEQNDNGTGSTTLNNSVASPTKIVGPNFLSFSPTVSPTRTFPRLSTILAGLSVTPTLGGDAVANVEALSSVARTLNFRLTVRDNSPYSSSAPVKVGQTAFTDMVVTVDGTTGPFLISSQNSAVSYQGGTTQTVTWSVNGTTGAPINCANVKISYSTDGGLTFPTVLSASTPNDGTETFTVPSTITTTARIKVESIGNIFFDINNANITVTVPASTFEFGTPAATTVACGGPTTAAATLTTTSLGGFSTPITLSATAGVPAGTTVSFSPNPVNPGSSSTVTLNNVNTLSAGNYDITITGTAGAITNTRVIRFTVQPGAAPTINTQPQPQTVCVGINATFTVAATGALSYLWQVSTDGGTNYNPAPGTNNTATYTVTAPPASANNNRYRVIVTGQCASVTSTAALLTVNPPPAIAAGGNPQSQTLCLGSPVSFTVNATGGGLTYLWQVSTDGGTNYNAAPGANTAATYTIASITAAMNNNRYRAVVTGACAPAVTSAAAILTVINPVVVGDDPDPVTICETGNVTFTVAATSSLPVIYEWQVSTDGGANYTTLTNVAPYSGATTPTLTVTSVTAGMNGYRYRARVSNSICTTPVPSAPAILTVNARPTVTLAAAPLTSLLPGQSTTLTATIVPSAAGFNITWYKNDIVIPGVTGTTYVVDSVEVGTYKVAIVNATTGCNNESNTVTITTTQSERLFIFPSPNDGRFTVSYYNSAGIAPTRQTINVYSANGSLVYSRVVTVVGAYTLNTVDLRGAGKGVYLVVIGDANGKRIAKDKVLIH